jgi:ADP-heptose:LPS heptosyltransferase
MVLLHQVVESLASRAWLDFVPKGGEACLQTGNFGGVVFHEDGCLEERLRLQDAAWQASLLRMPSQANLHAPKSLLVIKPSSLGDIVHALQVIQTVALNFPDCRITWVARDRFAPLVEAAPFVDEVIVFRRKKGIAGILEVMAQLRRRRSDAVWDMQGLLRSGLMTAAARSRIKWGRRDGREGSFLFSRKVCLPSGPGPHHAIPILAEFAKTLGIDAEIRFPLNLRPCGIYPWQPFFEGGSDKRFVIFTDSRGVGKEWPRYSELTRLILERMPESRVAWCAGSPTEPDFDVPKDRFLNLSGCPFDEMLALARQSSVFIGNDSGPMHLSAAVGNKVLAIFGPTPPEKFGPWPIGSPRTASVRAQGGDLKSLSAEEVYGCLVRLIES